MEFIGENTHLRIEEPMAIIVNQDYIEKCKIQSAQQLESAIQGALQLANNTLTLIKKN